MARVVGMKHSDFDVKKLKKTFSKNSGKEITTDDIRNGWAKLKTEIDSSMIDSLRKSPYFLRATNG